MSTLVVSVCLCIIAVWAVGLIAFTGAAVALVALTCGLAIGRAFP